MKNFSRIANYVLAITGALGGLTGSANAATLQIFPTGTQVALTLTVDTATSSITGADVRGLAGVVVTDPPITNGVLIGDFGLLPAPSTELIGVDANTQTQALLFQLNIAGLTVGGPGIEVPVTSSLITSPITDPALLEFEGSLEFGFTPVSSTTVGQIQTVVLDLATVNQVPEPISASLLGAGLMAIVLRRRKSGSAPIRS